MPYNPKSFQKRVDKPWGYEILYTSEDLPFTGKIMVVNAGKRWSLHYHTEKQETLCCFSGKALLWLKDSSGNIEKIPMKEKNGYTIPVNQIHRVEAITECIIIESSLPEMGTTVRVEDDYARPDETEELRKQDNRGWKV